MPLLTEGVGPHVGQPISVSGAALEEAESAVILLHGRGGNAADMLGLADIVAGPRLAALALNAAGQTWYPYRFTEPVSRNEPYLSSALSVVENLIARLVDKDLPAERIALLGFSQGGCLALECASRHAARLGAVIGLSGGLIGENIAPTGRPRQDGLPVFLGCSERDPHIPLRRVRETEEVMHNLGAQVVTRIYAGNDHGINQDEIDETRRFIALVGGAASRE
jgi:phospholipase/carboxylesterase